MFIHKRYFQSAQTNNQLHCYFLSVNQDLGGIQENLPTQRSTVLCNIRLLHDNVFIGSLYMWNTCKAFFQLITLGQIKDRISTGQTILSYSQVQDQGWSQGYVYSYGYLGQRPDGVKLLVKDRDGKQCNFYLFPSMQMENKIIWA